MAMGTGPDQGWVFISYRREDTAPYARLLQYELRERLPDVHVFMDVDSIEPGQNFVEAIEQAVGACEVMLVLIGRHWLGATDQDGRRRLDDPADLVRLEVQAALDRGIRVIPVLVDGVLVPRREQLPESLAALAGRNALELSHSRYPFDVNRLLSAVQGVLPAAPTVGPARQPARPAAPRRLDEQGFLSGVHDEAYRQALRALFAAARTAGLVFEWGTVGASIRLYTRDRPELTVAWVFPEQGGWYGLRHLTFGFDRGSAAKTPSVQALLDDYVTAAARIPGATPATPRSLLAYTFIPEAVTAHHGDLVDVLITLARKVQEVT